jgi:hypothetical protein
MQEKRSRPRLKVSMPVQVIGRTIDGEKFRELCQTQDASAFGLCLVLEAIVPRGTILFLSMQMPRRLRLYDLAKDVYQIYAQVQRVHMLTEGGCEVGLSFIGKNPPAGYENYQSTDFFSTEIKRTTGAYKPATTTQVNTSNPTNVTHSATNITTGAKEVAKAPSTNNSAWERPGRRDARHNIPIDVVIDFLDVNSSIIRQEPGLVTNISRGGACVMAATEAQIGSKVRISMMRENFIVLSCVKAITTSQGGVCNLHLEFLDKCWMGGG